MNLKFLLIPILLMSYTPSIYADTNNKHLKRLDITYKVPLLPLEISFGSDGFSWRGTKTIVTPIGTFSLGYTKYASNLEEDYTYVIIEDMNQKKEHIYKIKDKKKLKLVSEGRTEITITKNRVRIVVEKGSRFTVKFSVEGEDEVRESSGSGSKWFSPTKKNISWKKAKQICRDNDGRLPTIEELKEVVVNCGGINTKDAWNSVGHKNMENKAYQSCYKRKGFTRSGGYWSSTAYVLDSSFAWFVLFYYGQDSWNIKSHEYPVQCVRAGQ